MQKNKDGEANKYSIFAPFKQKITIMKALKSFSTLLLAGMLVSISSCKDGTKASDPLADSGRTERTENLLANMDSLSRIGYMFGHHDDTVYGIGWVGDSAASDVKSVCNDYPAVIGFDIANIELGDSVNIDGVSFDKIREEVINQYNRGGVVTISWHANNPSTTANAWVKDANNPTSEEKQTVASILEGGKNHDKFVGWLKNVSTFLNSLETPYGVRVPVIFRPWHENTGSWFWWGKAECTPEQFKALWVMTIEQLKNNDVVNALYAYSPGGEETPSGGHYMERYPGDEYVDVLGLDIYCMAESSEDTLSIAAFANSLDKNLDVVCNLGAEHNKVVALTETGFEGIKTTNWWTATLAPVLDKHNIAYAYVWRNAHDKVNHFYAPYPGQKSASDFVSFYNLPKTLFAHDLNGMYLKN